MGWGKVDDAESIRAIHRALDLGVTLFDTANNYGAGHSETILGKALKGRRSQTLISTKFGSVFDEERRLHFDGQTMPMTKEAMHAACEDSLRRLQTDYLDLYLLHAGNHPLEEVDMVIDLLEGLVQAGKIRWYGWSTDDPERIAAMAKGSHCAVVQARVNLMTPADAMVKVAEDLDLAVLCRSPLGSGLLTGKFNHESRVSDDQDGRHTISFSEGRGAEVLAFVDRVKPLMPRDRSLSQAAISWLLSRSDRVFPIPGFKNRIQVEENVSAAECPPLSGSLLSEIEAVRIEK